MKRLVLLVEANGDVQATPKDGCMRILRTDTIRPTVSWN
jgi:hypothetical protein